MEDLTTVRLAHLGLGSNLGDRAHNLDAALRYLHEHPAIQVLARARVLQSAPMYVEEQPEFLNTCAAVRTSLGPHELLAVCLQTEQALGRLRAIPNGPRTIDIDLLLVGEIVQSDDALTLPHPAMLERPFVLEPLAEIAGSVVHPLTRRTILEERDRG